MQEYERRGFRGRRSFDFWMDSGQFAQRLVGNCTYLAVQLFRLLCGAPAKEPWRLAVE